MARCAADCGHVLLCVAILFLQLSPSVCVPAADIDGSDSQPPVEVGDGTIQKPPALLKAAPAVGETHTDDVGNNTHQSDDGGNQRINTTTELVVVNVSTTLKPTEAPVLPKKGSQEEEHESSMAIFFILFMLVLCILLVHILIVSKCHYIPESLAMVVLGAFVGFILTYSERNWTKEEAFSPNAFFLILLPPIIFESGYNLHKGNFFANIGSILLFAIFGTAVSAFVVGGGMFVLGQMSAVECFAFGSLISAVDPVATLAIFQALNVDPLLYMLVFGESVLNDAVAIVLTSTVLELRDPSVAGQAWYTALAVCLQRFMLMFFGSAALGVVAGLMSALLLKHIDLRRTPSLEFAIMLVFAYLPYGLAEGLHLSGIMAILFCGVVMSHYTHFNLSPMTQITMQQTFRTLAFVSETCVFAYLGMAIFTYPLIFKPVFLLWAVVLCLVGRAVNIFPLSYILNFYRKSQITRKTQFVMWFSGLRGAVAFALSLHIEFDNEEVRRVMITTTLTVVLFTLLILGGSTLPLLKLLERWKFDEPSTSRRKRRQRSRTRRQRRSVRRSGSATGRQSPSVAVNLSKTKEMNLVIDPAELSYSEYAETDAASSSAGRRRQSQRRSSSVDSSEAASTTTNFRLNAQLKGLVHLDALYLRPFFVRKFTAQEKNESTSKLADLVTKWYKEVEQQSDSADDEVLLDRTTSARTTTDANHLTAAATLNSITNSGQRAQSTSRNATTAIDILSSTESDGNIKSAIDTVPLI